MSNTPSSNNNAPNVSSRGPPRSADSMASVGIGDCPIGGGTSLVKQATSDLPSLVPEGAAVVKDSIYNSIVFLIYCPQHDQIAVTNVDKCKCAWLPFVVLTDSVSWEQASHEGVAILIGRNDAEMDAEQAERTRPIYGMTYLHILRLQMPSLKQVLRLTRFVRLFENPNFQCCQNTDRVNWVSAQHVLNNLVPKAWGPELRILTSMLLRENPQIILEFTLDHALHYLTSDGSIEQKLLQEVKLTKRHVYEVYTNYVEHCYPSFYMCFESFRAYFIKYGWPRDEARLTRMYDTFRADKRPFVDFHEFLIGLSVLEPTCSTKLEVRSDFIFKYYDVDQTGYAARNQLFAMVKDSNPSWQNSRINTEAERLFGLLPENSSYNEFFQALHAELDGPIFQRLCRSPKSVLEQIYALHEAKKEERARLAADGVLQSRRTTKGTCWSCRAQQYEYGNHCVTIDTVGRCVEPTIISKPEYNPKWDKTPITRSRYSLEYVFALGSLPNMFIDLVRDFNVRKNMSGLMAAKEKDCTHFVKYLRLLCKELNSMLSHEDKLIKVPAPAIVIGDLQGNLTDLLQLEKLFFQSFPIFADNLVFLGNYSGECGFGVECLVYLFALKLCSPNKVFLLRGINELNSRTSATLQKECARKYGQNNGRIIHETFLQIFAKLPIAVVVDDNVLCTHSGIPSTSTRLLKCLSKLPKDISSPERDCPAAYEAITRYPSSIKSTDNDVMVSNNVSKPLNDTKVADDTIAGNFKTLKSTKQNGAKYRLVKSKKSSFCGKKVTQAVEPSVLKSIKSKSKKSSTPNSTESIQTPQSPQLSSNSSSSSPKTFSPSTISFSINKSLPRIKDNNSNSNPIDLSSFENKVSPLIKMKPVFLKSLRMNRKSIKFKPTTLKATENPPSKKQHKSTKGTAQPNNYSTFDRTEFVDFMRANDLTYLLRSQTVCANGFKIDFANQCLTVFSCSNYAKRNNQAAVALIDGANYSVRFIRIDTSCLAEDKSQTTTKNTPSL